MEDALLKELEELRAENRILRDSLVEYRTEEAEDEDESEGFEKKLQELLGMFQTTIGQTRDALRPGTDKLTALLSHQMEVNPVPLLLAAFSAGYLATQGMDKKDSDSEE